MGMRTAQLGVEADGKPLDNERAAAYKNVSTPAKPLPKRHA